MKNLFRKSWFQILLFGMIAGGALIVADNQFGLFSSKKESGTYQGPVSIDKKDVYMTTLRFRETEYDFGKVKEGDTISHAFKVTNTGKDPLFIYKISGGNCDCIGTSFKKDVIAPGGEDEVIVFFATKGRKGAQSRKIVVTANTDPSENVLMIKAMVE